jgi:hypothetical protein
MTQMFNDRVWIMDKGKWLADYLCLKKRGKPKEPDEFGVILSSKLPMIVYLRAPNFDPQKDFMKTARYDSYDDLIADGWRVD